MIPLVTPGQPIKLSEQKLRDLGIRVSNRLTDLESSYSDYFKDIQTWWKWYYAEPRMKEKNFPFKGASNLVVPLAQIASDGLVANAMSSLYGDGHRLWTVLTENEQFEKQARNVSRYINWQANGNDFDMFMVLFDWLNELYPIGSSVLAINYRDDVRYVWTGNGRGKARARPVRYARGPVFEHAPRECYLWDTAYTVGEAPEVYRKFRFNFSQLAYLSDIGKDQGWLPDQVESVRTDWGEDGPDVAITRDKREREGRQREPSDLKEHDIRECHLDWPVLGEMGIGPEDIVVPGREKMSVPSIPIVVTVHRKTRRVLRVIAEPYNFPFKPFFDGFFRKRPSRGSSEGVSKRLEQMQLAMTTIFNQAIDANTRANSVWGMTSNRKHLTNPIDPSRPMFAPGMDKEFRELNFPKNPGADLSLMQVAQVFSERQVGQSDPALGRETRQGGHPSPATSTLALLDRTTLMASGTTRLLRNRISLMGGAVATLDQQFETDEDGKLDRALGPIDGDSVRDFLFPTEPIFGNFRFDIVAMSESANPETDMRRALTVSQMNHNYWAFALQGAMALDSGRLGQRAQQVWVRALEAQTRIHERFLEATNVDDIEQFTLSLQRANQQLGQGFGLEAGELQQLAGEGRELARGAGAVPNNGVGGAGNGAAGPALGSLGALSV